MECFDISHFQGSAIVASQVAVTDGEADKSRYRRFKIKTRGEAGRLRQHVRGAHPPAQARPGGRRTCRTSSSSTAARASSPAAHAAMKDLGVDRVDVVGLAKSRDLEVLDRDAESAPQPRARLRPGPQGPHRPAAELAPSCSCSRGMRDEAHRFAITFQRKLMRQAALRSRWRTFPGVGEGRQEGAPARTSDRSSGCARRASRSWPRRRSGPRWPSGSTPTSTRPRASCGARSPRARSTRTRCGRPRSRTPPRSRCLPNGTV